MIKPDMVVADRLLEAYLDELSRLDYIDSSGKDFFIELARINHCPPHDFVVAALVDFIIGMEQEPNVPEKEESIH